MGAARHISRRRAQRLAYSSPGVDVPNISCKKLSNMADQHESNTVPQSDSRALVLAAATWIRRSNHDALVAAAEDEVAVHRPVRDLARRHPVQLPLEIASVCVGATNGTPHQSMRQLDLVHTGTI